MFIVDLTYKVELIEVEIYLEKHILFLEEQYSNGVFIASGRKVPRTGGIILSNLKSRKELMRILEKDPFKINNLADYRITEFIPSMTSKEMVFVKE